MSAAPDRRSAEQDVPIAMPAVLRVAPAPRAEPAADGQDWAVPATGSICSDPAICDPEHGYVQGSLAVDLRDDAYDSFFGPQATGTAELPEAQAWARRIIRATLEAWDGSRPPGQLSRWLAPEVRDKVARRGQLARRRGRRPHRPPLVRTVLTCYPADGVCEVSAVVRCDGRVRALALRMSGVDGRWLVTAFELG